MSARAARPSAIRYRAARSGSDAGVRAFRERWHIVNLPAIAEDPDPNQFPASCTVKQDWRQPGEALCPERRPLEKLHKICKRIGAYFFDSLFQQRPSAKEGEFFKVDKLEVVEAEPAGLRKCRAWDLAASKGTGAYTAGVLIGADDKGIYYVCDVERGQLSADDAKTTLRSTAVSDGQGVAIHLPQDPGQAGRAQAEQLVRFLAGFNVKAEPVTGSKETRAFGFAAQVNSGNVKMVRGAWNKAFKEELR
jgi:predicted phage terminase large subunit-like protein